jgi:hypothetical protein
MDLVGGLLALAAIVALFSIARELRLIRRHLMGLPAPPTLTRRAVVTGSGAERSQAPT